MAGFGPLLILIASFVASENAYWKLEKVDYLCGLFSALALILWIITKDPSVAIIFSMMADAFAAAPTVLKCWRHPETESSPAYVGGIISALTAFTVIATWTFPQYAFPVYLVVVNSILAFPLLWKRTRKTAKK